jgi:two-component system sensor histidine kinase GlrK
VAALKTSAAKSRNQVVWQLLAMIPSALLMIAGFTYLLVRPIRDLDEAIHRLGEGKLAKRISVSGPRDIEMLGEQLDWLRQRLISLEDQKTRFFQHVSHELKTPLTALREGSDLLSDEVVGKLTDEQREVAQILKQNSLTLEKLIQDLLTYSQTQSADRLGRKTALDIKPLQLRDLIDQVINAQRLAVVAKSITVKRECEKIPFQGDIEKLRVVIDNLFSNAIKYSPVGGTIVLRLVKHKEQAVIEVIDSGPGIPMEDRDRIFDPFYRGKNAAIPGVKGSGLGLAIVRDYVEMHHGTVKAIAAAGAHIRVILPKVPAAA